MGHRRRRVRLDHRSDVRVMIGHQVSFRITTTRPNGSSSGYRRCHRQGQLLGDLAHRPLQGPAGTHRVSGSKRSNFKDSHPVGPGVPRATTDGLGLSDPREIRRPDWDSVGRVVAPTLGQSWAMRRVVANQATIDHSVDLTGLSVTVTVAIGHRVKITRCLGVGSNGSAGDRGQARSGKGRPLSPGTLHRFIRLGPPRIGFWVIWVGTPSAGSHTYKGSYERVGYRDAVPGSPTPRGPSFILVEDIGP